MTTARRKFMPVKEIARYMVQLLRGLAHLHKHKVVHCDVSPQNVFLRRDHQVRVSEWPPGAVRRRYERPIAVWSLEHEQLTR